MPLSEAAMNPFPIGSFRDAVDADAHFMLETGIAIDSQVKDWMFL